MNIPMTRRAAMAGVLTAAIAALPGCTTVGDFAGPGLAESVRRLLTVSAQRAFAGLLREQGFFADELARVRLPDEFGRSGAVAAALLRTPLVRSELLQIMNRAAAAAAERAAPLVYDTIRSMSIVDAAALARGGPTAATDYLQRVMGPAIVEAMAPGVGDALRRLDTGVIGRVAQAATGIDFIALRRHVAEQAAAGIYRAIGREEARLRANPAAIDDPLIARLLGAR